MKAVQGVLGIGAWLGVSLIQLVIGGAMVAVAWLGGDAIVEAMGQTADGGWRVVAIVLFFVILAVQILAFGWLIRRVRCAGSASRKTRSGPRRTEPAARICDFIPFPALRGGGAPPISARRSLTIHSPAADQAADLAEPPRNFA